MSFTGADRSFCELYHYSHNAIDVASVEFYTLVLMKNGGYLETIPSGLQNCLNIENRHRPSRAFKRDLALLLFKRALRLWLSETDISPLKSGGFRHQIVTCWGDR